MQKPGEIVGESLKTIFKKGLLSFVIPNYDRSDAPDVVNSKFKAWRKSQTDKAKNFVAGAFAQTTKEDEVQRSGINAVRHTMDDGLTELRSGLPEIISASKDKLTPLDSRRTNYERFKDILGYKATDKWHTKIFKSGGARLLSWGAVPVLSHVSARVAAEASIGGTDVQTFKNNFGAIFSGLLSRWSGETNPNASAIAPGAPAQITGSATP